MYYYPFCTSQIHPAITDTVTVKGIAEKETF
jgi:hypothetical protein